MVQRSEELAQLAGEQIAEADLVIVGSHVPEGAAVAEYVLSRTEGRTAFYDIETPHTLEQLDTGELDQMKMVIASLAASHVVLSALYTGGMALAAFQRQKRAAHDLTAGSMVIYRLKRAKT